jgi:hypothetical protein
MGTLHIGQRFISPSIEPFPGNIRLSPAAPISRPLDADAVLIKPLVLVLLAFEAEVKRAFPFCAQVIPGCQLAEHREQNSLSHVGHFTGTGSIFLRFPLLASVELQIWHIVLQPTCGHQALFASRANSK